jgi:hypothetical protein
MTVMKLIDEHNTMQEYWSMTSLRLSAMVSRTDKKPLDGNTCSVVRVLSFHMSNEVLRSTFLAAKSGVHYRQAGEQDTGKDTRLGNDPKMLNILMRCYISNLQQCSFCSDQH